MIDPLDLQLELECMYCNYKEVITVPEADYILGIMGNLFKMPSIPNSRTA